jgi:peptidoglycan hydrolase CwlO-like protein
MRKKYKSTGFARFIIIMLFLVPIAYIGASYVNGEDGLENIKNIFTGKDKTEKNIDNDNGKPSVSESKVKRLEQRIKALEKENDELRDEIEDQEETIKALKEE